MSDSGANEISAMDPQRKQRTLMVGGVLGALVGVGVAYLLVQRAERQGGDIELSGGEGIRLGLLVLGMLRQVADLANPEKS